jgi:rhodanese-related sulfurtransferase
VIGYSAEDAGFWTITCGVPTEWKEDGMRAITNQLSGTLTSLLLLLPLVACDAVLEDEPSLYTQPGFVEVSVDEVVALFADDSEVVVIDVSPIEYQGAIVGAIPFPSDLAEAQEQLQALDGERDYLIVSAVEVDGAASAELLAANTIGNVYLFEGDDQYWNDAGLYVPPNHVDPPGTVLSTAAIKPDNLRLGAIAEFTQFYAYTEVDVETAASLMEEMDGLRIIDVSPNYAAGHIPGAESFPYNGMGFVNPILLKLDPETPYLVYGQAEVMSKVAARAMVANGFKQVFRMAGNIVAWEAAGFAVEKAKLEIYDAPRPGEQLIIPKGIARQSALDGPNYVEEVIWDVNVSPPPPDPPPPSAEGFAD